MMMREPRANVRSLLRVYLTAIMVCCIALAMRCLALGVDGLWLDEVYSASFASLAPIDLVIAALRFDLHPPLYYLQLAIWGVVSLDDNWLLANSIAWSIGTLLLAGYGVCRLTRSNYVAWLLVTLVVSVLGSEVYYASELRMYAMISFLTVLGWVRADHWLEISSLRNSTWLVAVLGALGWSHSTAFIPVSSVLLYAIMSCRGRQNLKELKTFAGIVAAVGVLLTPWLINASLRSVSHTVFPTVPEVLRSIAGWAIGYGALDIPDMVRIVAGCVIVLYVAVATFIGDRKTRLILVCFVIWPTVLIIALSYFVRPIWISRVVAFSAPFLAISVALFWYDRVHRLKNVLSSNFALSYWMFGLLIFSLGSLSWMQATMPHKMQYRDAALLIAKNNIERLPILVPGNVTFWGMARYLRSPDWGSILDIQDPVTRNGSDVWGRIYDRLGSKWLERLHLVPTDRKVSTDYGDMWIGSSPLPQGVGSKGVWVVGNNNLTEVDACGNSVSNNVWKFRGVVVFRCSFE